MASRGVYLWGHAAIEAQMRELLLSEGANILGMMNEELILEGGMLIKKSNGQRFMSVRQLATECPKPLVVKHYFTLPNSYPLLEDAYESCTVDPTEYKTHHTIAYNTTAVEVEVNEQTGEIQVLQVAIAIDAGKVINPEAARTQVEGAIIMGMGIALNEEFVIEEGINITNILGKCRIPRISIIPKDIIIKFIDANDPSGPLGSKGVTEVGVLAIAPAIANAVYDAISQRIRALPIRKHLNLRHHN